MSALKSRIALAMDYHLTLWRDQIMALVGLIIFLIPGLIISYLINREDRGPIFFLQPRVGRGGSIFMLLKFRSMKQRKVHGPAITQGTEDSRITAIGKWLRRYKLDELPQLINILKGDMRFVGPRPEVEEFIQYYPASLKHILNYPPGLTDPSSLEYGREEEILGQSLDPVNTYITVLLPEKLNRSLIYLEQRHFFTDFFVIAKTAIKIFFK